MALNLYGIVRAGHRLPPPRTGPASDPRLFLVGHDALAVVASEVGDGRRLADEDALTHLDVLCELVLAGPVLPLSFGTVAPDEDAVRAEALAPHAADLRHRLDRLDGLVEMRAELTFDVDASLRVAARDTSTDTRRDPSTGTSTGTSTDAELRRLAAGRPAAGLAERIQLGEQLAAALARWWRARAEQLLAPVQALAERSKRIAAAEHNAERWAFLLRLETCPQVAPQLARVAAAATEVEVSSRGPLPAYSFLDDVAAEAPSASRWGW